MTTVQLRSWSAWIVRPVLVVVAAISSTMTRRLVSGVARQFMEMNDHLKEPRKPDRGGVHLHSLQRAT